MKKLVFDCSTDIATVAVLDKEQVLSEKSETGRRNHAAILMPAIDECLKEAGLAFRDIDEVYACSGPGSFTGARVGLATALGLCRPLGKPLYIFPYPALVLAEELRENGSDYLKKLAEGAFSDGEHIDSFGFLLDAGRRETYCMYFDLVENKVAGSELFKAGELEGLLEKQEEVLSNGLVLCRLPWCELGRTDRVVGMENVGSAKSEEEFIKNVIYSNIRKELHAKAFFTLSPDLQKAFLTMEAEPLYFRKSQAEESLENKKKKK